MEQVAKLQEKLEEERDAHENQLREKDEKISILRQQFRTLGEHLKEVEDERELARKIQYQNRQTTANQLDLQIAMLGLQDPQIETEVRSRVHQQGKQIPDLASLVNHAISEWFRLESECEQLSSQVEDLTSEVASKTSDAAEVNNRLKQSEELFKQARIDKVRAELEFERASVEVVEFQERIKRLRIEGDEKMLANEELSHQLFLADADKRELSQKLHRLQLESQLFSTLLDTPSNELEDLARAVNKLKTNHDNLIAKVEELKKEKFSLIVKSVTANAALEGANEKIAVLENAATRDRQRLESALARADKANEAQREAYEKADAHASKFEMKAVVLEGKLGVEQRSARTLEREKERLERNLEISRHDNELQRNEIVRLEQEAYKIALPWDIELKKAAGQKKLVEQELERVHELNRSLDSKLGTAEQKLKWNEVELEGKVQEIASLKSQLDEVKNGEAEVAGKLETTEENVEGSETATA